MIYVSFILPAYNVAHFISEAISSLMELPENEIEVIVVNDGSTDNTLEVVKGYEGKIKNLKIIDQKNRKLCIARNNGFLQATGKYIHFFDSDDIIEVSEFKKVYQEAKTQDWDIIAGNAFFYKDGQKKGPVTQDHFKSQLGVVNGPEYFHFTNKKKEYAQFCWLFLIKRDFLTKNEIKFTEGIKHEDKEFAAKCFARARTVKYIPAHFVLYRQRSTSISYEPTRYYSPESVEDYKTVISNLSDWYLKSNDESEKSVLNRAIAECFATIYRRIPLMKKHKIPEVKKYNWNYINSSNSFHFLTLKNKMLVLEKRFKAFIR